MSIFGNGSDGTLNVTSGTHNLELNRKYQFTTVNIAAGATLSTDSTTGAVLYLCATDSITIDGAIDVSNKVIYGNNSWSVTIDGVTYSSPGVAPGGYGGFFTGQSAGIQGNGFGAGGSGASHADSSPSLGIGGTGSSTFGAGGARFTRTSTVQTQVAAGGNNGSASGGGSGFALTRWTRTSGDVVIQVSATSGAGGNSYGANGEDGVSVSAVVVSGTGNGTYYVMAGGGGGAGGRAGKAGVHVVLLAPSITINGSVITSGTNGQKGGDGGRTRDVNNALINGGLGGGGGGGGRGGNVSLVYSNSYSNTGTITKSGGSGGIGGSRGGSPTTQAGQGNAGSDGTLSARTATADELLWTITPDSGASTFSIGEPTLTPGAVTITTASATSTMSAGTARLTMFITGAGDGASTFSISEPNITQSDPPPPPPTDWGAIGKEDKKVYIYKVYQPDGTFVGIWNDVLDDPQFTQRIGTPGTTMTVRLGRSADKTIEVRESLVTESGETLTTEDGHTLMVVSQTPNSVGADTDVELNYNVDIYCHYGEFEPLTTEDGEDILTEDGEQILVAVGAPFGVRIFSGFILDYESRYGASNAGVTVTLASHGYELSHQLIRDGETTTVTYPTQAIETTVKDILDTNPGTMSYDNGSILATGVSVPASFQLNTKLEGIEHLVEQSGEGWYWYGGVGDRLIHLKEMSTTPDHVFILGKHIKGVSIKRSLENLINRVYFVGGELTPGDPNTTLFKKYEDTTSQTDWRVGLHRKTDRRYTLATSTQKYADKMMARFSQPIFTTPLTISSARYDIESIRLGQTVGFANFDNFVDNVVLQIVNRRYSPYQLEIELGDLLDRQSDIISDVERNLENEQYTTIPSAPS